MNTSTAVTSIQKKQYKLSGWIQKYIEIHEHHNVTYSTNRNCCMCEKKKKKLNKNLFCIRQLRYSPLLTVTFF